MAWKRVRLSLIPSTLADLETSILTSNQPTLWDYLFKSFFVKARVSRNGTREDRDCYQPLYRIFSELSLSHPFPAYSVKAAGQSKGDDLKAAVPRVRGETLFSLFIGAWDHNCFKQLYRTRGRRFLSNSPTPNWSRDNNDRSKQNPTNCPGNSWKREKVQDPRLKDPSPKAREGFISEEPMALKMT